MLNNLLKSDFIKNSSILIIGTGLAQLIPILIQPIIRRTYTDFETGQFDLYMSFVAILASLVHLNYSKAIVIPKNDISAKNLLGGTILSSLIISSLLFIIFLSFGEEILKTLNLPNSFKPWLKYIPLSVFLIGSYTSMTYWLTRIKKFKSIALNKFSRRTGEATTQLISKGISPNGLIFGAIIGDLINFLSNIYQVTKVNFDIKSINRTSIKDEFIKYKDFPIYSLLPTLLNTMSTNLPVIMITSYYSVKTAGQFGLSRMVLAIPLALISVSISQVLLQRVAEKQQDRKSIKKLMKNVFIFLATISLTVTITISFWGEELFNFAFGKGWSLASNMSKTLIFYYCISFIATPTSVVFIALNKIKINSLWQIFHFLAILTLYFFKNHNIEDFVFFFMIINLISYVIYLILTLRVIKDYESKIVTNV